MGEASCWVIVFEKYEDDPVKNKMYKVILF